MKPSNIIVATLTAAIFAAPVYAETREYQLDGFDEISLAEGLEAEITIGDTFSIVAEARSERILDKLDIEVRGHTLYAGRDSNFVDFLFGGNDRLQLEITLPDLNEISVSSGAGASVSGDYGATITGAVSSGADLELEDINAARVELSASSGADLDASGTCEQLEVSASSGSDINAKSLECNVVDVSVSSGADADVFASETLESRASSGGDVDVYGSPTNTDISDSSGGDTDLRN